MNKSIAAMMALSIVAALAPGASMAADKVLKFGHDNKTDPFENPAHACTAVFANIVAADTNGSVTVEVFPSNQLGSATEHVQMVRDNVIQGTLASTGAMASYYPRIDVLNLAFAFDHNAATYDVFDGGFGVTLARDIEADLGDVVVLGFPDTGGFFAVTNSKRKIVTLEDFVGVRIRTMTLPSHQKIIQSLGGKAFPLSWGEVYSGLQTGVIDGQMNPIPIISFAKFAEVQSHLTLTNHLFSPYTMMLSKAFWDTLTPSEQRIIGYAAHSCVTASRGLSRIIEASDRGLVGLKKLIEVTALADEERERLKQAAQPAVIRHIEEAYGEEGVALLDAFRAAAQEANSRRYMR